MKLKAELFTTELLINIPLVSQNLLDKLDNSESFSMRSHEVWSEPQSPCLSFIITISTSKLFHFNFYFNFCSFEDNF